MMTDKAPAALQSDLGSGDAGQGKGGTQEFLAVECHSHKM